MDKPYLKEMVERKHFEPDRATNLEEVPKKKDPRLFGMYCTQPA